MRAKLTLGLLVLLPTVALAEVGVSTHSIDPALAPAYAASGVKVVRFDLPWSHVVRKKQWAWQPFDAFVAALKAQGITPMPIVQWDHESELSESDARRGLAEFVAAAHARWPGVVFELLNEPNLTPEQTGNPNWRYVSPEVYAQAVAEVRAAVPTATLVGPAVGGAQIDEEFYIARVLAAGVADHLDGFSVHPYGVGSPVAAPAFYDSVRVAMRRTGREVPIIVSEWGFLADEQEQAALLSQALEVNRRYGIGLTVVYCWRDGYERFGLIGNDGQPKPAYHAVREAAVGGTLR